MLLSVKGIKSVYLSFELGCFEEADVVFSNKGMTPQQYMNLYLEALRWQQWLPV